MAEFLMLPWQTQISILAGVFVIVLVVGIVPNAGARISEFVKSIRETGKDRPHK
jgi:hypothetical protein